MYMADMYMHHPHLSLRSIACASVMEGRRPELEESDLSTSLLWTAVDAIGWLSIVTLDIEIRFPEPPIRVMVQAPRFGRSTLKDCGFIRHNGTVRVTAC